MNSSDVAVVVPTYGREAVLLDTLRRFLALASPAAEIIVVDQTAQHEVTTERQLAAWLEKGLIRWLRPSIPSQPAALNLGVATATAPIVLFVDDDIDFSCELVATHAAAYDGEATWAVVGQILQPGEVPLQGFQRASRAGPFSDLDFPFRSSTPSVVTNGMSGNLSVRRQRAIELGGFDENFLAPVSYRFDSEFCKRIVRAGGTIAFRPEASINHLRAPHGGTRSTGSHLTSASPMHGIGDYYFALRSGATIPMLGYIVRRPLREVATRFHLRHPWWIPVKLFGEVRAFLGALMLLARGPRYPLRAAVRSSVRESAD